MSLTMAQHPIFAQTQTISDICKPLERFNINYFSQVHVSNDSEMTCLHTHPEFITNYLSKNYHHADIFSANQNHFGEFVLWDSLTCKGKSNAMLKDAVDFGFQQFFTLIEKDVSGINFYYFASPSTETSMSQLYLSNIDALQAFTKYFKTSVKKSKELSAWHDIKITIEKKHSDIGLLVNNKLMSTEENRREFFNDISARNNFDTRLSNQQINCLHLLAQGFSAKEIAERLNLSRRTVESYLAHVRNIFGCRNSNELIAKYYQW